MHFKLILDNISLTYAVFDGPYMSRSVGRNA